MRVADKGGAWDGAIMATLAEHVEALEEIDILGDDCSSECDFEVHELKRVHSVGFQIERVKRHVWVQYSRRVSWLLSEDDIVEWDKQEDTLSY